VIALEKETSLAAQAHFGLANLYRKQGNAAKAQHEMREYQKLQAKSSKLRIAEIGDDVPQHACPTKKSNGFSG